MFFVLSTGLDSTPNDGIYTGVLTANQMAGDGYYNIRVSMSIYFNITKLDDLSYLLIGRNNFQYIQCQLYKIYI